MPSWLLFLLAVLGMVAVVGLQAAAVTADWRVFWVAVKQFSIGLLAVAAIGAVVGWIGYMQAF